MERYTIADFNRQFSNDATCLEWLKNHLYPNGIFCEKCGRVTKHHKIVSRRSYSCDVCGHHVHPTSGTIFEKSTTPLKLWFHAIFLMSSTRCGISAKQIQRETGVTYKTAWRMFKEIRSLLCEDVNTLSGQVEVDETYIDGKQPGKRGRSAGHKVPVLGMFERNGKAITRVIPDVKAKTLLPMVTEQAPVEKTTTIFTDELPSYNKLTELGYNHETVQHAAKIYVSGIAHVNNVKCLWSHIKEVSMAFIMQLAPNIFHHI